MKGSGKGHTRLSQSNSFSSSLSATTTLLTQSYANWSRLPSAISPSRFLNSVAFSSTPESPASISFSIALRPHYGILRFIVTRQALDGIPFYFIHKVPEQPPVLIGREVILFGFWRCNHLPTKCSSSGYNLR
jgi:hypothetical protein